MPVHETEFHGGCAVVVEGPDENWFYTYCGEKVYGSRGDWLMCRFHHEMFAPQPTVVVRDVVFITIIVMIVAIVALLVFAAWQGASADPSTHLR